MPDIHYGKIGDILNKSKSLKIDLRFSKTENIFANPLMTDYESTILQLAQDMVSGFEVSQDIG